MNYWKIRTPDGTLRSGQSEWLMEGLHIPGFVIGAFENTSGSLMTIPSFLPSQGADNISDLPLLYEIPESSTTRKMHESNVAKAVAYHAKHGGKTVISRVLRSGPVNDVDAVFDKLDSMYASACVFQFSTSPTGTWIGASPELLLEASDGKLMTMALAGTRAAGTQENWDEKNLHEQEIVAEYILSTLSSHGLEPVALPLETRNAGNIEHLLTRIEAPIPDDWSENKLVSLLSSLSPTPALGGYPLQDSLQLISKLEEHQRGYYGGFFGYIANPYNFRLNVNLRSALLTPDATLIFVGGGITGASVPEEEWEETCRKANTVAVALN